MRTGIYASAKGAILGQTLSLLAAGIKAMPLNALYVPDYANHSTLADVGISARVVAGVALTGKTLVQAGTGYKFDADDVSFTGVPNPSTVTGVLLYLDGGSDAASKLIGYFDYFAGMPFTVTTGSVTFQWPAYAIFVLDDGVLGGPQGAPGTGGSTSHTGDVIDDPGGGANGGNLRVVGIEGFPIIGASPVAGNVPTYDGAGNLTWETPPGGGTSTVEAKPATSALVTNVGTAYTVHGDYGVCTLEQFGAVGDGVTDDSVAFSSARAALAAGTYHTLRLGSKVYYVPNVTFALPAGCSIVGQAPGSSVLRTTANQTVISVVSAEKTVLKGFTIRGNSTGASQHGITAGNSAVAGSGPSNLRIIDVDLEDLGGDGFWYAQNPLVNTANTYLGPTCTNLRAQNCSGAGFRFSHRGEYARMTNCHAMNCGTPLVMAAGNVSFDNSTFTSNTNPVTLTNDSNGGHSEFTGCAFNHNTGHALTSDCQNGHKFVGCSFYALPSYGIQLTANARMHLFSACQLSVGLFSFAANVSARFVQCIVQQDYTPSISDAGSTCVTWEECRDCDAVQTIPPFIQAKLVQTFTFGSDANATLEMRVSVTRDLLVAAGVITATRTITSARPPNKGNEIRVSNGNAQNINYAWSSGASVTVPAGKSAIIGADGTNARLIILESTAGSGEANTMSSSGTGASIVLAKSGVNLPVRSFIGTSPIGVTQNATDLTFAMVGGANGKFLTWQGGVATWGNLADYAGLGSGTLATFGLLRCQSASAQILVAGTKTIVGSDATSGYIFTDGSYGNQCATGRVYAGTDLYFGIGSTTYLQLISDTINPVKPVHLSSTIGGNAGASNPFSFRNALIDLTGVTTKTAAPAEYSCPRLYVTRGTGTTCEVVLPNGPAGTAFLVTVDAAIAGLEVKFTHISGGAGATVSTGQTRWVVFDTLQTKYVLENT